MGMYGSRAVTLLVLISDNVINRILKLDIQTNILVYVTRCCTDLTSKVLMERTFGQSSAVLIYVSIQDTDICIQAKTKPDIVQLNIYKKIRNMTYMNNQPLGHIA